MAHPTSGLVQPAAPADSDKEGRGPSDGKRRTKPQSPDPIGGRFLIAAALLLAMLLPMSPVNQMLQPGGPEPTEPAQWQVGKKADVSITLVTADYQRLACMSDQAIDGKHCAYKEPDERWPQPQSGPAEANQRDIIQPYRTVPGNHLIFVAGLWADPSVAMRLHREPPRGVAVNKLARFVADCEVEFIGQLQEPMVRWSPEQDWSQETSGMVARPIACEIRSPR